MRPKIQPWDGPFDFPKDRIVSKFCLRMDSCSSKSMKSMQVARRWKVVEIV